MRSSSARAAKPKLLAVNFDYFFANLHDTGGDPDGLFDWPAGKFATSQQWAERAAAFLSRGLPLPRCDGDYARFWDRFVFHSDARLWISDSGLFAASKEPSGASPWWREVVLYAARHESGYRSTYRDYLNTRGLGIDDWTFGLYRDGSSIRVRYPRWRAAALRTELSPSIPVDRQIDDGRTYARTIFSGVYVYRPDDQIPPWCDDQWNHFLACCPIPETHRTVVPVGRPNPYRWDDDVQEQVAQLLAGLPTPQS